MFEEQGETLKVQRFENTFFKLVQLHHEIIEKLSFDRRDVNYGYSGIEKREIISKGVQDFLNKIYESNRTWKQNESGGSEHVLDEPENLEIAKQRLYKVYRDFYFNDYKQILSHYYRNVYHIFKFIFTTDLIRKDKKQFYATLMRAQLSSDELLLIAYNSIIPNLGYPNFLFLIVEYDILQNFDFDLIFQYKFHKDIYEEAKNRLNYRDVARELVGTQSKPK